jgi:hypothetical protein
MARKTHFMRALAAKPAKSAAAKAKAPAKKMTPKKLARRAK